MNCIRRRATSAALLLHLALLVGLLLVCAAPASAAVTGQILISPDQGIGFTWDLPRHLQLAGSYLAGSDGEFTSDIYRVEVTRRWDVKFRFLPFVDRGFAGLRYTTDSGLGAVAGIGRDIPVFDDAWVSVAGVVSAGQGSSGLGLSLALVQLI